MGWIADTLAVFFIASLFQGLKLDPEDVIKGIEEAPLSRIMGRMLLIIPGMLFLHYATFGNLSWNQNNVLSGGLWVILIYETGALAGMIFARDSYVRVTREVAHTIPVYYRLILLAELGFFLVLLWFRGFLGLAYVIGSFL